jgi:membrane protein required for colicin V production
MNIADISIVLVLLLFVVSGFFEGFLKKIFGIIILIGAFFVALHLYEPLANWMQSTIKLSPFFSLILSFLLVFLTLLIGGNVLYRALGRKNELYRIWDKIAGAAFGLFEGALIVSLILHILILIDIPAQHLRESSLLYSYIFSFAPQVFELIHLFVPEIRRFLKCLSKTSTTFPTWQFNIPCLLRQ